MRRSVVLLVMVAVIAMLAVPSHARGRGTMPRCGMGMGVGLGPWWADSSGMNLEVRQKVMREQGLFMKETLELRTELFKKGEQLRAMYQDPQAKDEDILKLWREIHALRTQLAEKHMQRILKVRKELPDELRQGPMGACPGAQCMGCWMGGPGMGCGVQGHSIGPRFGMGCGMQCRGMGWGWIPE